MVVKLQEIDELNRHEHHYITEDDRIFFLRERSHGGYQESETNSLISNLKIKPDQQRRLHYKRQAIAKVARELEATIPRGVIKNMTFVPTPPSKIEGHPDFDDRIVEILSQMHGGNLDIRRYVTQRESMEASHETSSRHSPDELYENYIFSNSEYKSCPAPELIMIVDDVLTAGSHFFAMKRTIAEHYPHTPIMGLVIARQRQDDRDPFGDFEDHFN